MAIIFHQETTLAAATGTFCCWLLAQHQARETVYKFHFAQTRLTPDQGGMGETISPELA
jgi:hypothetical protein